MDKPSENQTSSSESEPQTRHRLTHLIIGSLAIGLDTFSQRLKEWQKPPAKEVTSTQPEVAPRAMEPSASMIWLPDHEETPAETARYAAVGLLFNAQDRLSASLNKVDRLTRAVYGTSSRFWKPITCSRAFSPVGRRWEALVRRGEYQVSAWVERGRIEEDQGVMLTKQVVEGTTDEVIDVLAVHPGIRQLVEKQGTGFANEFVKEFRERAVSMDTLLEGVVRKVLRRKPLTMQLPTALLAPPAGNVDNQPGGSKTNPTNTHSEVKRL